jgi:transposase
MTQATTQTIGMDVGDKRSRVCVLAATGERIEERWIDTTQAGVRRYFAKQPRSRVVLEAGTHTLWMTWLLQDLGHEAIVANPRNLGLIYASRKKSDPQDAHRLAQLGRVDPALLSPVSVRGRDTQLHLAQIRSRALLVATRTKLINHVRGLVKTLGHRVRSCDADSFAAVAMDSLPPAIGSVVEPVLQMIVALTQQLGVLDQRIASIAATSYAGEVRQLSQVHGVGALTALTFVLTLNDPSRFPKSRRVGAYLGLVPRLDQSGEVNRQLGITHAGETYLRTLLVGSAQTLLRQNSPDTDLKRYRLRVMERGGKNAKKRAVVAVARKLSVLLHRLWMSHEVYVPVGYRDTHVQAA